MAENDFNKLRVDDARITKLVLDGTNLFLYIRNWQEISMVLAFSEVIAVEGFGIVNVDLGGAIESVNDPFIQKAFALADEPVGSFYCYSMYSAWNEQALIKIVARSWAMEKGKL